MKSKKIKLIIFSLVLLAIILTVICYFPNAKTYYLQGEVDANRIDIAARVQGRASVIYFDVGDNVKKGDLLMTLSSPALEAQKKYVESQLQIARANRAVTYSTRPENIDAQKAALEKSDSDLKLAKTTYDRLESLSKQQSISKQQLDETRNKLEVANKARIVAQANYELALNGSSVEAKLLADAQVEQAQTALDQLNVDLSELEVRSPVDGQIITRVAEIGQLYNPGTPLFSMINLDNLWLTFNVREDRLYNAHIGQNYSVFIPALNEKIEVKVTTINALGQYANWKATKATGDFDLKTFEVRAKPILDIKNLRPGMSATATWN